MPLRQVLEKGAAFEPADLEVMTAAFSMALQKLELNVRDDPMVEQVGRNIIRAAMHGERDPDTLCQAALDALDEGRKAS